MPHHARQRASLPLQAVIELGRKIRERGLKPIKTPLRKLVVVHPDTEFLADIKGGPLAAGDGRDIRGGPAGGGRWCTQTMSGVSRWL